MINETNQNKKEDGTEYVNGIELFQQKSRNIMLMVSNGIKNFLKSNRIKSNVSSIENLNIILATSSH